MKKSEEENWREKNVHKLYFKNAFILFKMHSAQFKKLLYFILTQINFHSHFFSFSFRSKEFSPNDP
jgi:hypothetical protein